MGSIKIFTIICILGCILFTLCNGQAFRISQNTDCGRTDETDGDVRTKAPWTAAIFGRAGSKSPYQFAVSGTLIGPSTVLTLFGGAYGMPSSGSVKYFIPKPENYIVAFGIKSNNLDEKDPFHQISQVSQIIPWRNQSDQNYYNFYIFHLLHPVSLSSPHVRTACIPLFLKAVSPGAYGRQEEFRQSGFGVPARSDGYKDLSINKITFDSTENTCEVLYKVHYEGNHNQTFCGTVASPGNSPVCLEPSSSITIPVLNNRWFVIGITALIPNSVSKSWCNKNTRYFFGKVAPALDWITENVNCSPNFACAGGNCIDKSKLCDQKADCPNGDDEDPIYCRARNPCIFGDKTYECGVYGKCISPKKVCDGVADCEDGRDERTSPHCPARGTHPRPSPAKHSPPNRQSPPLKAGVNFLSRRVQVTSHCIPLQISEGVEIECQLPNEQEIPCTSSQINTVAKYRCKQYYKSTQRSPTLSVTCSEDGTWKPARSFGCTAECGVISNGLSAYIYGGQDTSEDNAFPWHSAIFKQTKTDFQFICGGSLVERNVILTAAHCVSSSNGAVEPKGQFRIVLGVNSSSYNIAINSQSAQVYGIKEIFVPGTYDRRSLQSDIAIVELDKAAVYGKSVRPVCYLERGSSIVPAPGTLGKVPGYGFRENNKISENLIFAQFPVISSDDCKKALERTPPLSTFCAGYRNGTSVCQGDSGSSMVFESTTPESVNKYFIRGIVSFGEAKQGRKCDPNNFAVFTHVDSFADWILQRVDGIIK